MRRRSRACARRPRGSNSVVIPWSIAAAARFAASCAVRARPWAANRLAVNMGGGAGLLPAATLDPMTMPVVTSSLEGPDDLLIGGARPPGGPNRKAPMAVAPPLSAWSLFDGLDPHFIADPYPAYRRLREGAPVWRSPLGFWVLSRHADVAAVLRDPRFGRDFEGKLSHAARRAEILKQPAYRSLALSMLARDPPDHTRLRGLVAKAFTARRVEALREGIEACVDRLIDRRAEDRQMDLIAEFARLLPVTVICDLLGIPESDRARFLSGYQVSARLLDPTPLSPDELEQANTNTLYNRRYFEELFRCRSREPADDLISALLAVPDDA